MPNNKELVTLDGMNVYSLVSGLMAVNADFFTRYSTDARTCLAMVKDASEILAKLLDGGKSVVAGRLTGAFRNIGNDKIADEISNTMKSAEYMNSLEKASVHNDITDFAQFIASQIKQRKN